MSQFAQPSKGGDKFDASQYNGKLLLIFPLSLHSGVETMHGTADAVEVDIVVLDQADPETGQPVELNGAWLFGRALVSATRNSIGEMVLGRLGQGVNTKGSPPWILNDHTDQEAAYASQWLQANPRNKPKQPSQSPPTPPPAPDPWAGVNTAPAPPQFPTAPAPPAAAPPAAAAPVAAPAAAPAPTGSPVDQFLAGKGVNTQGMDDNTKAMIAQSMGYSASATVEPPF